MQDHVPFWEDVFTLGGSDYFDIGNIHSINSDSDGINSPEFKSFLENQNIDKPFWITEVELDIMNKGPFVSMEDHFIINLVSAFASDAEKIFVPGIMKKDKEIRYLILQLLVDKIDYFNSVEKLDIGQCKFTMEDNVVYVLWGEKNIPEEIIGQIKMTDVEGSETILNITDLSLSDSPVFIEIIKFKSFTCQIVNEED